jgi:uncharacterized membrane protein YdbT with pleckstrin-like domain
MIEGSASHVPSRHAMTAEQTIWNGSPSQIINLPLYILCGLFFWLVVPVFYALWKFLVVKFTQYELTSERLKIRSGVINRKLDELELYRVRDYKLEQPLSLRIFRLGNVVMQTSDKTTPTVILRAIHDAESVRENIRTHVEACRMRKGVREIDFE